MAGPLPVSLRQRVVEAWENGEGSFETLGKRFKVGEASVNRWVALKRKTGSVAPKPMGGARRSPVVDDAGMQFLKETLEAVPDSTLVELCASYLKEYDVKFSPQTMSATVPRLGFTRKRGSSAHGLPSARTWSSNAMPSERRRNR